MARGEQAPKPPIVVDTIPEHMLRRIMVGPVEGGRVNVRLRPGEPQIAVRDLPPSAFGRRPMAMPSGRQARAPTQPVEPQGGFAGLFEDASSETVVVQPVHNRRRTPSGRLVKRAALTTIFTLAAGVGMTGANTGLRMLPIVGAKFSPSAEASYMNEDPVHATMDGYKVLGATVLSVMGKNSGK